MADINQLKTIVEQAVSQRLKEHVDQLRQQITDQVVRDLQPVLAGQGGDGSRASASPSSDILNASLAAIQQSTAQADILKALLEGASKFSSRTALFVVRGTTLAGWQARGFSDENVRGVTLDGSAGLASKAIRDRNRASASAAEFDSAFIEHQGSPWDGRATVFPLVVKEKVAAVLYCDSGRESGRQSDYSAVELLTRHACLWLEHAAVKKHLAPGGESGAGAVMQSASASAAPAAKGTEAPAGIAEADLDKLSPEDQDLHKKAKRFAKLLVDEIKLYNQVKVTEGKQNRDIYKLLREDIEKSRATYDKRYGSTPVALARYFDSEVVRILADNDRSLLGNDFPG
jgi:hypothetical protein